MAFAAAGMTPISNGPSAVFHYQTNDTLATVVGANYFDDYAAWIPVGSIIHVSADLDGTPAMESYIVSANTYTHAAQSGAVTITVEAGTP